MTLIAAKAQQEPVQEVSKVPDNLEQPNIVEWSTGVDLVAFDP